MRLKLKHLMKDKKGYEFNPIDLTTVFEEDEGIAEWLDDPSDALLDELDDDGQPTRPNTFLATWANRFSDDDGGVGSGQGVVPPRKSGSKVSREGSSKAMDDDEFDRLMRGPPRRKQPITVNSSTEDDHNDDGSNDDGGEDDDEHSGGGGSGDGDSGNGDSHGHGGDGGGCYEGTGSQSPHGIVFTVEEGFTHATQDEDHGSRRMLQYERRSKSTRDRQRERTQNPITPHGMGATRHGADMINDNFSTMSISGSGSEQHNYGSSSSYGYGSGHGIPSYDYGSGYDTRGYEYGSSIYGYGSGYDSQTSSSYRQDEGWSGTGAFVPQQIGCSVADYQRFGREYNLYYRNNMSWSNYCHHIYVTYRVSLSSYPEPPPMYEPARHSTGGWM